MKNFKNDKKNLIIVSLGGSLIAPPSGIDWQYLKKFRQLIIRQIKKGRRFIIVTGGGHTCREYQGIARKISRLTPANLDWIGIYVNRMHAQFLHALFGELAHPKIFENQNNKIIFKEKVLTAGGFMPGQSSDAVAVYLAKKFRVKTIINLSNINYVYDQDPKKYKNARPIERINWTDFRKIVGSKWLPGLNAPFDPTAALGAKKACLGVIIARGNNLINLSNILNNKKYQGTTIGP